MLPATIAPPFKDWVDRVVIAAAATAKYSSIDRTIVRGMFEGMSCNDCSQVTDGGSNL